MPTHNYPIPRRRTPGNVYILKGISGLYKIGSSNDIKSRISQICRDVACKVELTYTVETKNMHDLEMYLHKYFKDKRVWNEWFLLSADDLSMATKIMEEKNGR